MEKKKKSNGKRGSEPEKNNTEKFSQKISKRRWVHRNNGEKKVPKWKLREELESRIKILKRGRKETRAILNTMLRIGIKKGGFGKRPRPIIKPKTTVNEGGHRPNTVHGVFDELLSYEPAIFSPLEKNVFDGDKHGYFTKAAFNVFENDIKIYKELQKNNLVNELEGFDIEKFRESLEEFYGRRITVL